MTSPEFWGAALLQGGGLGIFGDFMVSSVSRGGRGIEETVAGPCCWYYRRYTQINFRKRYRICSGQRY